MVAFGLYGNSTAQFETGSSTRHAAGQAVQGFLTFVLNGIVFFFAGASSVNFLVRWAAAPAAGGAAAPR